MHNPIICGLITGLSGGDTKMDNRGCKMTLFPKVLRMENVQNLFQVPSTQKWIHSKCCELERVDS